MRNNPCPAEGCNREFARGMNLKAHIRTCHKDLARQLDEEGWPARLDTGSIVESVAEENVDNGQGVILETNAVEQIQPNEEGEMTWVSEDQVVQLAHGDTFNSGNISINNINHFMLCILSSISFLCKSHAEIDLKEE